MIKIFHTGDIHLDSAFCRLSREERNIRRGQQRELFRRMMKYVSDEKFDMMLISGDLFDGENVSPETEECVISVLGGLSCPVLIAPGNHDTYMGISLYKNGRLPENVYVFNSEELQIFNFDELGVRVCGYAFMQETYYENPLNRASLPEFDGVSVLCAHTDIGAPHSSYASFTYDDVEKLGFCYAALGHVHNAAAPIRMGNSLISYCGFAEGRAFDEIGYGGAMSVTIEGTKASAEKIVFSERAYFVEKLNIGYIHGTEEARKKIENFFEEKKYKPGTALRLILEGETDSGSLIDKDMLLSAFSERFSELEIIFRIYPSIDIKSLEADRTLRGEVYRILKRELCSADDAIREQAQDALRAAIFAIEGRDIGGAL